MPVSTDRGRYEGLLLRLLRDEGPRSRTRLSEDTGLSPTTITKAMTPLLHRGWVEELADAPATMRVGRPAIAIRQRPEAITVIGVQLGVGTIRLGLADGWGRVTAVRAHDFDPARPAEDVIESVADLIAALVEETGAAPIAIGVASPGAVDTGHRRNVISVNLDWRDVPVADLLERRLGIPTVVEHNVRAMALAEARYGGHAADGIAYVYIRTGVGLGLVLHGEPFFGGSHGVSELGHIRVIEHGVRCACGSTGCLETVVSEPYLASHLAALGVPVPDGPEPGLMATLEGARDRSAVEELRAAVIAHLAQALGSVVNLLSPDVLLLGGALADAPDSLLSDVADAVRASTFTILRDTVRIERPRLAEAGVSGGAAAALEAFVYADGTDGS